MGPIKGALEAAPGLTIGSVHNTEPVCRVSGYLQPLEANAHLIATAPDLYDALEKLIEKLALVEEELSGVYTLAAIHGVEYRGTGYAQERDDAVAVLAKARGESID